jgi:hypothetical protein
VQQDNIHMPCISSLKMQPQSCKKYFTSKKRYLRKSLDSNSFVTSIQQKTTKKKGLWRELVDKFIPTNLKQLRGDNQRLVKLHDPSDKNRELLTEPEKLQFKLKSMHCYGRLQVCHIGLQQEAPIWRTSSAQIEFYYLATSPGILKNLSNASVLMWTLQNFLFLPHAPILCNIST